MSITAGLSACLDDELWRVVYSSDPATHCLSLAHGNSLAHGSSLAASPRSLRSLGSHYRGAYGPGDLSTDVEVRYGLQSPCLYSPDLSADV